MEILGVQIPTLAVTEENFMSIIIQGILFVIIAFIMIEIVSLYFKNIELKKDPEKNQAEIQENFAKIEKIKKSFVKIGGIVFAVIFMTMIILSNFIEF